MVINESRRMKLKWKVKTVASYQLLGSYTKETHHVDMGDGRLILCPDSETAEHIVALHNENRKEVSHA